MSVKFTIEAPLPTMNEMVSAMNRNRFLGNKLKKDAQEIVMWEVRWMDPFDYPAVYHFEWHVKDRRKDPDNICSYGRKVIFDALQKAGKLPNDNMQYIRGFSDTFVLDKDCKHPHVIITVDRITT